MAANSRHWFGCGFLLGLVLFGLSAVTAVARGGSWWIGVPVVVVGSLSFGWLSARYREAFWKFFGDRFRG